MLVVAAQNTEQQVAPQNSNKKPRVRSRDKGQDILSHMEHFVRLVRKIKHADLVRSLVEKTDGNAIEALSILTQEMADTIPIAIRDMVFAVVKELPPLVQLNIERAAERVLLLCDEYGMLAVNEQLHAQDTNDAAMLALLTDKFSRALYLYLCQAFPLDASINDRRFDHAEARQEMLRQGQSEKYSSHYLGPKSIAPQLGETVDAALRERLSNLFPHIDPDEIAISVLAIAHARSIEFCGQIVKRFFLLFFHTHQSPTPTTSPQSLINARCDLLTVKRPAENGERKRRKLSQKWPEK